MCLCVVAQDLLCTPYNETSLEMTSVVVKCVSSQLIIIVYITSMCSTFFFGSDKYDFNCLKVLRKSVK
jgi:Mg2+/citrate symporter